VSFIQVALEAVPDFQAFGVVHKESSGNHHTSTRRRGRGHPLTTLLNIDRKHFESLSIPFDLQRPVNPCSVNVKAVEYDYISTSRDLNHGFFATFIADGNCGHPEPNVVTERAV